MDTSKNINVNLGTTRDLLRNITKDNSIKNDMIVIVNSVDTENFTCDCSPIDNPDIEYYDVKLSSDVTGQNVNIPVVGSRVIISFLDSKNGYVSMFSEIDKIVRLTTNSDEKAYFKSLNNVVKTYMENIHNAINNATFKHPYGATLPSPINLVEFEQLLNDAKADIDKLDKEIDNKYL